MRLHVKKSSHLLGYVAMKSENANPLASKGDLHEAFDFIPEDTWVGDQFLPGDARQAGNLWPEDLPGFHDALARYGVAMRLLSRRIFGAFALALGPAGELLRIDDRPADDARSACSITRACRARWTKRGWSSARIPTMNASPSWVRTP